MLTSVLHSGYGGVTIWDVKTSAPVLIPHLPYDHQNPKHTYSASTWLYFEGIDKHIFIVGNMAGDIFVWTWDRAQNVCSLFLIFARWAIPLTFLQAFREVTTQRACKNANNQVMSMDVAESRVPLGSRGRIVTSTADRMVAVWSLTSNLELSNVFTADLPGDILPRTVKFARGTENVFVFSKMGGSLYVYNCIDLFALNDPALVFSYTVKMDNSYGPRRMGPKRCTFTRTLVLIPWLTFV